jgi:methylase of polypeptide subunit release factors
VWDGAVVLARYIEAASRADPQNTDNRRSGILMHAPTHCLELGAGTGLAGLAAAQAFQVLAMLPLSLPSSREQAGKFS